MTDDVVTLFEQYEEIHGRPPSVVELWWWLDKKREAHGQPAERTRG